ncbi:lipolytic enzyme [Massariosphaeria phaeospora]|uniref:Lipolytic enzyme n=1 Tax=Massariosphaeria phaeospora TaxID=100035 RepID=A0A7C8MGI5_9PLEO|nr:lipolytic enzyme [Massariosphaeria phaeospora]
MFPPTLFSAALATLLTVVLTPPTHALALSPRQLKDDDPFFHWTTAWTSMPQLVEPANMPPSPFSSPAVLRAATLRQTLLITARTPRLRIAISNLFGPSDLPITAASLGLAAGNVAGTSSIQAAPLAAITVDGAASFVVPRGKVVVSDAVAFEVKAQTNVAVSLYSQAGQSGASITGHPGSRTTSWFVAGEKVNATAFAGTASVHWYFVSAVHAYVPTATRSLIILGDSITDGRGSDDNKNNRPPLSWPDLLLTRLLTSNLTTIALANQAAGGNRVLQDGLGPSLLSRYQRDALTQPGAQWVLLFSGVNDIGTSATSSSAQSAVGDALIRAFTTIAKDAQAAGLVTIGATITPFGGQGQSYSDRNREATRQRVNRWILESGTFDHVVDFGGVLESKTTPGQLDAKYDGGDHLHPNAAGFKAMAEALPLEIFKA